MSDPYYDSKRKVAENEAELDLKKSIQHLLVDVHDESLDARQPDAQRLGRVIARFASMLSVLSEQSDKLTRRIVRLTWSLAILTVALLILTGYLCYDAYSKTQRDQQQHQDFAQP